jgi:hypothetical protein
MKRPVPLSLALFLLALLFGWKTQQALEAVPAGADNAVTAATGSWQPGVPALDPPPPPDTTQTAAAIAARPLFRPDRQPFREQTGASAARNYETELSRFTLLGVLAFGEVPVGVVAGKTGNKTDRWELKAGDALPGFTVKEVGMDGLLLTADGREFLLPLYAGPPTAAAGALRTEIPRRDAATPGPAPGSAVPAKPPAPPAPAVPSRPAGVAPAPPAPGVSPAPLPSRPPPIVAPRYIPGRR